MLLAPKWDASFDKPDAIPGLLLGGSLYVNLYMYYFSSCLAAFGFWAAALLDKIVLNSANKKTD